jgi:hypothetical protein
MLTAVLVASLCTTHVANYPTSHVSVAGPMCVGDFIAPADADSTSGSSQIMKDQATIILQTPAPAPARPPAVPAPQVSLAVPDTPQAVPDPTPSKVNPDGLYYPQNYVKLGGQIEQKTVEKQVAEAAPKPVKNFFRARKVHHRYHYRHRVHRSSHAPSQFVTRPKSRGGFWWWEKRKN